MMSRLKARRPFPRMIGQRKGKRLLGKKWSTESQMCLTCRLSAFIFYPNIFYLTSPQRRLYSAAAQLQNWRFGFVWVSAGERNQTCEFEVPGNRRLFEPSLFCR